MSAMQPQPVAPMSVMGNRNARNLPVGQDGREWSHGICDCCGSPGTCLVSWYCPCITYGRNKRRYDHLQTKGTPDPEHGGCVSADCLIQAGIMVIGFGWLTQCMLRGNIRERYNVSGGSCTDCLASCFCLPCALTQEAREIELEEATYGKH